MNCLYRFQKIGNSLPMKMMISAPSVRMEGISCAVMDAHGPFT